MTIYDIIQFAWLSLLTVYALLNRELIKNLIVKNNERSHNSTIVQQSLSGSDDKSSSPKSCFNCKPRKNGCDYAMVTNGNPCSRWDPA
jgi:hypothetical protein